MATNRMTWKKLNVWRVLLQIAVLNVAVAAWLIHAIATHNPDEIWASALFLALLGIPQVLGWVIMLRREPLRSFLFKRRPISDPGDAPRKVE